MDGLAKEYDQIRSAFLHHYAVINPPALNDELNDFRERAGLTQTKEESMALALKTVEGMKRLKA